MAKIPKVILLLATSRAHGRGLLYGIARYCQLHGPWIIQTEPPYYRRRGTLSRLKKWGADGVIAPDAKENREIIDVGLPTIIYRMTRHRIPHLPAIIADNKTAGVMAAEHLLDRGFQRFAYFGLADRPWSQERCDSFTERILDAGYETDLFHRSGTLQGWDSFGREQDVLSDWLKSLQKPVGVMAGNDSCGRYVMQACRIGGLEVPDEVAVIGVDNDRLICDLTEPPLSSIAMNTQKAGYGAAGLLERLMGGETMAGQDIVVEPTHIVARQSTDILAIDDRDVAAAVRYIRQHAKEAVQVGDVVAHVAISRRGLERRFHGVLGRSIHSEIKRVRIQQIVRMLTETDLPISQIAVKLGHQSEKHLARYFKQQTATTPLEYRKQHRDPTRKSKRALSD